MMRHLLLAAMMLLACTVKGVEPSGTLPVLYINTTDNLPITSNETYVNATYWLDPMGDSSVEAIGSAEEPLPTEIRGRGNWTWQGFDKKPYKLKLEKKKGFMGMNKSKHWALMAHADDNLGFMRAPLAFKLSYLVGLDWAPDQRPVEMVLNGDYVGLYFITENVRVAKDRVNVFEQLDNDAGDVTGGWLVEFDNYMEDNQVRLTEGDGAPMWVTSKTPEVMCPEQEEFLRSQLQAMDDAFYKEPTTSTLWETLIDKDAYIAFYLVQELTDSHSGYHGSCYMHREKGVESKWMFGPVWDFGGSWQRANNDFCYNSTTHQTWIPRASKFDSFNAAKLTAMEAFLDGPVDEIEPYITAYAHSLKAAAEADAERWPTYGNADIEARAAQLMERFRIRTAWLAASWGLTDDPIPAPTIYLRGADNGWAALDEWCFTPANDGSRRQYLDDVTLTDRFKIADAVWGDINYGRASADAPLPELDVPYPMTFGGVNIDMPGHYTRITVDMGATPPTITMSQRPIEEEKEEDGLSTAFIDSRLYSVDGNTVTCGGRTFKLIDLSGAIVGHGTSITARPGIYIAVADNASIPVKILIK